MLGMAGLPTVTAAEAIPQTIPARASSLNMLAPSGVGFH